eukprot:GHVN01014586.1.p1 GENE.GHVN01014586.1~~GHVN01014586.1.p1  ORF type:complete len:138 (-),score=24.78 GHVN01014586.1:14-370(-)
MCYGALFNYSTLYYFSTIALQLGHINANSTTLEAWLRVFAWVSPVGVVGATLAGLLGDKKGIGATFTLHTSVSEVNQVSETMADNIGVTVTEVNEIMQCAISLSVSSLSHFSSSLSFR